MIYRCRVYLRYQLVAMSFVMRISVGDRKHNHVWYLKIQFGVCGVFILHVVRLEVENCRAYCIKRSCLTHTHTLQ